MLSTEASKRTYAAIREKILQGEDIVIAPQGTSMYPFLIAGRDRVLITPIAACRRPHRGDVILYRRVDGLLVLHRLHHQNSKGYYFVGDNQIELEGPLNQNQLLGIASRIYRGDKSFTCRHPIYWAASRLWLWLRPFRHAISRPTKKILIFLHLYKEKK